MELCFGDNCAFLTVVVYIYRRSTCLKLSTELPQTMPVITGGDPKQVYKPGDILNLTCTSAPSNPAAKLEWTLNDEPVCDAFSLKIISKLNKPSIQVNPEYISPQQVIQRRKGLLSTTTGLLMILEDRHFQGGEIRVKCKGTIAAEFWRKDVVNVYSDNESFLKVLEVHESSWPGKGSIWCEKNISSNFFRFHSLNSTLMHL